jgi:FkbM family methyltransferase
MSDSSASQSTVRGFGLIDAVIATLRPLQFRGKGKLVELFVPRAGERSAVLFGSQFHLDTSDYLQRHMYAGSFERLETQAVLKALRPGMTFVDVGANVGYYTALAAQLVGPSGAVYAFEPSDYAHPRLTKMVETSGHKCVRILKYGLSDVAGESYLYGAVNEEPCELHTATMVPSDDPQKALVRTERLDDVAGQLGIQKIDLIKIDVDGLEPMVLKGATKLISQGRISSILAEYEEEFPSATEMLNFLKSSGYRSILRIGNRAVYASSFSRPEAGQ